MALPASVAAILLAVVPLILAGQARSAAPGRAGADTLTLKPCQVFRATARCGTYWVFEDRVHRTGRKIPLKVIVLPSTSSTPAPDPVLLVSPGGPGTTNSETGAALALSLPMRDHRDIVLIDLRGTSGPNRLDCGEERASIAAGFESMFDPATIRACRAQLEEVADLSLYTTPLIVDDLAEVVGALGYHKVNLIGMSWGTRAVLVYMRRHPVTVRTAIMLGVVPLSYRYPLPGARGAQRELERVFAACGEDATCHAQVPDPAGDFATVLGEVKRSPPTVRLFDPFVRDSAVVKVTEAPFVDALRAALYAPSRQRRLPLELHRAAAGDWGALVRELGTAAGSQHGLVRLGFLLSVACTDDGWRISDANIRRETAGTFSEDHRVREQLAACAQWPKGQLPPRYTEPVQSDIPALLVSGEDDPVTPPQWGAEAAGHLSNGLHLVAPGGHVPGGSCIGSIERAFVDAGSVNGLDTSCVGATSPDHL